MIKEKIFFISFDFFFWMLYTLDSLDGGIDRGGNFYVLCSETEVCKDW